MIDKYEVQVATTINIYLTILALHSRFYSVINYIFTTS